MIDPRIDQLESYIRDSKGALENTEVILGFPETLTVIGLLEHALKDPQLKHTMPNAVATADRILDTIYSYFDSIAPGCGAMLKREQQSIRREG